jgi:hypothetical protein
LANLVTIVIADKRCRIVSKLIDLLLEELEHERGVDLYVGLGAACDMAVPLFVGGPLLWASSGNR